MNRLIVVQIIYFIMRFDENAKLATASKYSMKHLEFGCNFEQCQENAEFTVKGTEQNQQSYSAALCQEHTDAVMNRANVTSEDH